MIARATTLTLAFVIASASLAAAQQPQPILPSSTVGTFDVAVRSSTVDGDSARFQRYQDIRDQGAGFDFTIGHENSTWSLNARGRNVGYRDQQFQAAAASSRLTMSFEWEQTPLFYGNTTSTAYIQSAPGVFTLDSSARLAVQNGTALGIPRTPVQAQSASIYRALSRPFDLRSRRDRALFRLAYAATPQLTVNLQADSYARSGAQPWGAGFAFSVLPELPLPLDHRTTDLAAGAEWAGGKGLVRLGYEGSYFNNNIETLTWDNPVRATNYSGNPLTVTGYDPSGYVTGNGSAQGRMALAPSNYSHGVSGLGLIKLPSRSTLTAGFGVVGMTQDATLIPWTINPVIADARVYALFPGLATLDRSTAQADVRLTNASLSFSTHPTRYFGLTAKYRYFNRDDRTPVFDATDYVRFDAAPMSSGGTTRQLNLTRNTVNVDATVTPMPYTAFSVGVGRDVLDHARAYSQLGDTTIRAAAHLTGYRYAGLRAMFEHTVRDASGFDETVLAAGGAQPASRWYDDASRTRNRTTLLVDVMPVPFIGLNASAFVGRDAYDGAGQRFGLLDNDNTGYTAGFSVVPSRGVSFGVTGGYERYTALQRSRNAQAPPDSSWSDPNRDWTLDSKETVRTVGVNVDLIRTLRNTELRFGYDWNDSDQGFVYGGPRIDALAAIGQFAPLPAVTNRWQRATIDVRYFMTSKAGLGVGYWYNKFDVNDYQTLNLSDGTPRTDYVGSLMLGYGYRPFNASTGFLRVFYLF